jgi:hypothetical protein
VTVTITRGVQGALHTGLELVPVDQPGQCIVKREVEECGLRLSVCAAVLGLA